MAKPTLFSDRKNTTSFKDDYFGEVKSWFMLVKLMFSWSNLNEIQQNRPVWEIRRSLYVSVSDFSEGLLDYM